LPANTVKAFSVLILKDALQQHWAKGRAAIFKLKLDLNTLKRVLSYAVVNVSVAVPGEPWSLNECVAPRTL